MKKIFTTVLVATIFISLSASALSQQNSMEIKIEPKPLNKTTYTHTILGEYGTATWCGYCKYAHAALKNIYAGVWHPFYYVSLVDDVCTHADARNSELGLTGFPTVFFDNGYRKVVGAGSTPSAQAAYNSSILGCSSHTVKDVDMTLSVSWLGSGNMNIALTVNNNEASTYNGHLHVYVTEIVSSYGWYDTAGYLYTFPFLDYAANQDISISASGTYTNTFNWIGANHNNGHGQNYAGIQYGNIMVIAAVFQSSSTGYVDEAVGCRVGANTAPNTPSNPNPADLAVDVSYEPRLRWAGGDPESDFTTYDVYLEKDDSTPDVLVSDDQYGNSYDSEILDLESTYYWQIVATDLYGLTTTGPIWQFTTRGNDPPDPPYNPSPSNGETGVDVNEDIDWSGSDPNGDSLTYDVYFGTSTDPPKIASNHSSSAYNQGKMEYDTTYYWKIIAWDQFGEKTSGSIWSFTTTDEPNIRPTPPDITGKINIKVNTEYEYTFVSSDENEDDLYYYVSWGDGTITDWVGPYASGDSIVLTHTWEKKGDTIIQAKSKDIYDLQSSWGTLDIAVPVTFFNEPSTMLFGLFPNVIGDHINFWHGSWQQVNVDAFQGYCGRIVMFGKVF